MFRRQSVKPSEVIDAKEFEQNLQYLHKDKHLEFILDDTLAKIVQNSEYGYDIRYKDCGKLLWYNSTYNKFIHDLGWTLEDVKDWDAINSIRSVTSYDENLKLRKDTGHGLMHTFNEFTSHNINLIQMTNSMNAGNLSSRVTLNVPVSKKTGKLCPIRMTNYTYHNEGLVISEFILLYDFLPQIPSAILDLYK